jgi:hypothetical protein
MIVPTVSFEHLYRLSDEVGLFEHAKLTEPRHEHGYCVDDVARGLIVAVREPEPSDELTSTAHTYLRFVTDAQAADGRFHNRRGADATWQDEPNLEDCWGRAIWGLGTVVARAPALAERALAAFDLGVTLRSPWPRAMAFAALGAAEVLAARPEHLGARLLLADAVKLIGPAGTDRHWRWPEPRLHYANAALPETLIAAGVLLNNAQTLAEGLTMLTWLLEVETSNGRLSVAPVGGWAVGEARPGYDQQPIEVAALADACSRAYAVTGDSRWRDGVMRAAAWFLGENDAHVEMYDPVSAGGCDGLEVNGHNENQGAESTLAMLSTFQQANRVLAMHS